MNYFNLKPMNSSYSVEQRGTHNQVGTEFHNTRESGHKYCTMERAHTRSCSTSKVAGSKLSRPSETMKRNIPVIDESVAEDEAETSSTGE